MLDIKFVREHTDTVRQRLATRGTGDEARIDELLKHDEQRRKLLAEVEALKAQRNRVSKEIGALMGQKKTAEDNPLVRFSKGEPAEAVGQTGFIELPPC